MPHHPDDPPVTYADAIRYLYDLRLFGTKLGLETARQLADEAGAPDKQLKFIHVAGTNGKGSVCAMLESIYRAAGYRTALYTSPHLVSFRERFQIDRRCISQEDTVRLVQELQALQVKLPSGTTPTFFEFITVLALRYFAEQGCDIVIWETGMGGRLDATNIVQPIASVITNIALDHQRWLGDDPAAIAREKAGIIKAGAPVVTAEQDPAILQLFQEIATRQDVSLTRIGSKDLANPPLSSLQLPLPGEHQRLNAATALATVKQLQDQLPVPGHALQSGLSTVHWPGRGQIVERGAGRTLIIDGAHNAASAKALQQWLAARYSSSLVTFIFGFLSDKDWSSICRILLPMAGRVLIAPVHSQRALDNSLVERLCRDRNPYCEVKVVATVKEALEQAAYDPLTVATGSLYFAGEVLAEAGLIPGDPSEQGLNDWTTPQPSKSSAP